MKQPKDTIDSIINEQCQKLSETLSTQIHNEMMHQKIEDIIPKTPCKSISSDQEAATIGKWLKEIDKINHKMTAIESGAVDETSEYETGVQDGIQLVTRCIKPMLAELTNSIHAAM